MVPLAPQAQGDAHIPVQWQKTLIYKKPERAEYQVEFTYKLYIPASELPFEFMKTLQAACAGVARCSELVKYRRAAALGLADLAVI